MTSDEDIVVLEPFIHQVGGRATILVYDQNICKPINSRELAFYESLPPDLKPFVPEFRGVIEVYFNEDADGYLTISAKTPHDSRSEDRQSSESNDSLLSDIQKNQNFDTIFEDESNTDSNSSGSRRNSMTNHNPWVLKAFSHLRESESIKKRKFILLENLTSELKFPCIMDLKMGVRQYDDDATESKILSHKSKVAETTSGVLGLRITGIQVYNQKLDRFICHNKYYGRTLTPEGLKNALKKFLLNDNYSRLNLIPLLIEQLESLYSVIVKLETFRFYTSSLLILYEGMDSHIETNTKAIDIRMIDFAHSTHQFMSIDKTVHKGPDRGYIFGLNNLIKLLKSIESETNQF